MKFYFLGAQDFEISQAGKKASPLHELKQRGFSVPTGFVIPQGEIPNVADLVEAMGRVGDFPVAVRSSSSAEDLAGASFAGQYLTILNVQNMHALTGAIEKCRLAAKSPLVEAYADKHHIDLKNSSMAILIQKMIQPQVAGVAFSLHPITGRDDHALIECCAGLGEKLVSGQVAPSRYVLELQTGKILEETVGSDNVRMSQENLNQLLARIVDIQAYFGSPQDIEWAYDEKGIHILQSRPITKIQWRSDVEEFTNADFKDGGVSCRVCTPLMYSLYENAMQGSMQEYFISLKLLKEDAPQEKWIDYFYGRPYWNASAVKRRLFKIPGFDERSFDGDLGIQKNYGKQGPTLTPTNVKTILPAIPVALALEANYKGHLEFTENYASDFTIHEAQWLARMDRFKTTDDTEFFKDLIGIFEFQERVESDYFMTIYNNSNAQSDFKKLIEKVSLASGERISVLSLMSGLMGIGHMDIQTGLLQLYRVALTHGFDSVPWAVCLDHFLDRNYFHGDAELDLTVPRWGEDPARVRRQVEDMIASGAEPKEPSDTVRRQHQNYLDEKKKVETILGRSLTLSVKFKGAFKKQLERSRAYLVRREAMREVSTLCYYLVRLYVLEAGARLKGLSYLNRAEDIFMFHTHEIEKMTKREMERVQVWAAAEFRRKKYEGHRNLIPPNELGRGVEPKSQAQAKEENKNGATLLKGLGASGGMFEGPVRVVNSLDETAKLQKGEILVTRFTDPGWTPVLGLASGVITEVGGLLSHAAVIGREFGIPAVLNIPGVTSALKTGQRVRIDGERGVVEVLEQ